MSTPFHLHAAMLIPERTRCICSGYIERLVDANSEGKDMVAAHNDYHAFRLELVSCAEVETGINR